MDEEDGMKNERVDDHKILGKFLKNKRTVSYFIYINIFA